MKEAIKLIKPGEKYINKQLYTGVALLVIGVILVAIGGVAPPLGIGVLFIILAMSSKNTDIIKVYDNYFEIKLAPLAARRFIKTEEITNVDTTNPKMLIVHYESEGKNKKIKISKVMLEEADYQFVSEFVSTAKVV